MQKFFVGLNNIFLLNSNKISFGSYLKEKLCWANQIFVDSTIHFSGCSLPISMNFFHLNPLPSNFSIEISCFLLHWSFIIFYNFSIYFDIFILFPQFVILIFIYTCIACYSTFSRQVSVRKRTHTVFMKVLQQNSLWSYPAHFSSLLCR